MRKFVRWIRGWICGLLNSYRMEVRREEEMRLKILHELDKLERLKALQEKQKELERLKSFGGR